MAHRQPLLELLHNYLPTQLAERATVERFIQFVRENADCLLRSNEHGHVTGSCFLVHEATNEVLLTHHKKIGAWLQLGGHADNDADLLRVALREAEEESGIMGIEPVALSLFDIDIHEIAEHKGVPQHLHYDVRFLLAAPHKNFVISEESHNLAWVKIDHVALDMSMSMSLRRMAHKWCDYATRAPVLPK